MHVLDFEKWNLNEAYLDGVQDEAIIAATAVGEAAAEGKKGMQAVINVLVNRAKKKGTSPASEALRPKQFSMWNKATSGVVSRSDFDVAKIKSVISQYDSHERWDEAMALAKKASSLEDITGGATMYYASSGSEAISPPYWTKNWTKTKTIGNHTFGIL